MATFQELITSRRHWINTVLIPWCQAAKAADLALAEQAWPDLAGRVSPQFTLWMWAWRRFPGLVIPDLDRFDEALEIEVRLHSGEAYVGYPDSRRSQRDHLVLVPSLTSTEIPPLHLDAITSLRALRPIEPVPDRTITPSPEE